ncbi:DUF2894 domain-containing protein [Bordetella pseudohinzii]|uniref:Protein of uncharacterized function (DUF2894) n=1 Tax=Bordetella pseudohinzii TaxID=1331258 RepID=A0A0J6BR21_9BORD|nr:DUF2894 domain-containing protein [Bordetella pseudohinzii]ANY15211.1 hypothetical protein BBN53_04465 [Bordetella pseudohinzii]KMM24279.1 hypothetical protein L540_06720 [Bordetella pseudohinzii]CUI50342.1 Protein of uncharacterised function (DUF2894) [Bordetella pseudohinzii]
MDSAARLQAWREQGAHRADPVRFALLEALARRAGQLTGGARQVVEDKLARLIEDYDARLAETPAAAEPPATAASALPDLLAHIAERAAMPPGELREHYPELPLLDAFRAIWTRLSADQQLRQSLEQLPENAGPLNSDHLVHRALSHMRALSPDYLHQFMAYVETLSWLERLNTAPAPTPKASAGKPAKRRPGRAASTP